MSTAGKKGGGAKKKAPPAASAVAEETTKTVDPAPIDARAEDGASTSDGKKGDSRGEDSTPPKPPSAGVTTREGANKLLNLALKNEWTGVDSVMKSLEKAVANAGEDANLQPLAGVMDFVSILHTKKTSFFLFLEGNY